jgi:hypothetical protein
LEINKRNIHPEEEKQVKKEFGQTKKFEPKNKSSKYGSSMLGRLKTKVFTSINGKSKQE